MGAYRGNVTTDLYYFQVPTENNPIGRPGSRRVGPGWQIVPMPFFCPMRYNWAKDFINEEVFYIYLGDVFVLSAGGDIGAVSGDR